MISKPLYSDEFVGRREELGFLYEEFRAAADSRVRFVTIEGEAGIGKSRLLAEFLRGVETDAIVAEGRCSEHVRSPYLPFTEILERLDPRSRSAALKPRENGFASEEKWAYFSSVADVIRAQSARRPLVIAIEDAQWADSASIDLLRFILSRAHRSRCMVIVTLRLEPHSQNAAAAIRSTASRNHACTVQLRGLRRSEISRLVQSSVRERGTKLDRAMVAQIEVLSEGNPLFAEELARVALETGALSFQTQMPVTLQAILSERLAPFTAAERGVLYRAAVIGESFDAGLLAAIAEAPVDEILAVLERAVFVGLIREREPARFAFRHTLIRQVLADQLMLSLAAPLHTRIAQELEALPDAARRAPELAYHWSAARVAHKARMWNEAAGQAAWDVYAYRDAIGFYTEALRWNYPAGTQRASIYERLGKLLYIDGIAEEPAEWFARCRAEYERCGNAVGAAHALLLEADQRWVDARTREALERAAQAAAALKQLGHVPMYAQALLSVARYAITLGNVDQTMAHLEAASRYREHFNAGSRADWHEVRGETHAVLGNVREAMADFRDAAKLAAQGGVSELISQIENNFALAAFDLGELDLAVARHQIAVDEAHRTGMPWRIAYCSLNYARTLMFKSQLERAGAMIWSALQTGVATATFKTKAASVGIPLALLLNDRALLDACADDAALDLAQRSGEVQRIASVTAAFAALRVAQGSYAEARALLGDAVRRIPRAHRAWDLFVAVAQWGDAEDAEIARSVLAAAPGRPKLKRGFRLLFDALAAGKRDGEFARRIADAASKQFSIMGNSLYASLAAGRKEEKKHRAHTALTARQQQIAELVGEGETNRGIAERLNISEHTVEHHISGIFERLGLKSRTQLAHMLGQLESK
jgi:DNA-binding CsgD family transcriptional regulator